MTKVQKVILFFSILAYVGVLVSFFTQYWWLLLVFIVASSVLLISFNLAGGAELDLLEAEKNEEIDKIKTELNNSMESVKESMEKLADSENALNETMKLYRDAKGDVAEANKRMEEADAEIERIREEAQRDKEKAIEDAVAKALAEAKMSVDDNNFGGMDALIPNVSGEEIIEEIDLVALSKETVKGFDKYAKEAEINIKVNSSEDKIIFNGDPLRISIMLKNIIDNSIKYMNKAGSLVITLSRIDDEAFIVLKDDGNGLSAEETRHIFELNFQGSNRISGNGLGLTQSKAIADRYKGSIYARSEQGRGMGIYIQLPISTIADKDLEEQESKDE